MYYYPYYFHVPMNYDIRQLNYWNYPHEYYGNYGYPLGDRQFTDQGPNPYVVDIEEATKRNNNFRTALWTGRHMQVTLMSLKPGEDIGLEVHPDVDQFLRVEQGQGIVRMGRRRNNLNIVRRIDDGTAIMVPAGTWHNVENTGNRPLKLYSIYAPPEHPRGTVHVTKAEAMAAESNQGRTAFY
jgi:mannose-6-phosphate isomerase-like protein (cupin superfamily)